VENLTLNGLKLLQG